MNIINEPFVNDVNLAICIFPANTIAVPAIAEKMMDYTTFYALRFGQLSDDNNPPIEVFHASSIEDGMHQLSDKFDHILFMAAGVRIYDMSIIFDVKKVIQDNPNYLAAGHILEWKEKWYELHHQFVLVNSKKWIACGSPEYGDWIEGEQELPVIERSVENFHDDYTPLWIKFTGEYKNQIRQKQGWNFFNYAARNGFDIINWDQNIRSKRTYYYPEDHGAEFLASLQSLTELGIVNNNQKSLIKQLNAVMNQIWILNSEDMNLNLEGEKFDTIALPAAGFKFLDVFKNKSLNPGGKLIIYDFNPKSLAWIKSLHTSSSFDVEMLIKNFPDRKQFKFLGPSTLNPEDRLTQDFHDSFAITKEYFGGKLRFIEMLHQFRQCNVEFAHVNLFTDPYSLTGRFGKKTLLNISNIFCTDFSNAYFGMAHAGKRLKELVVNIKTECLIVGQDANCRHIRKRINHRK